MELLATISTLIITFIIPFGVLGYLIVNNRKYLLAFGCGVLTFVVFQVLTRIPLLQLYLPNLTWYFKLVYEYPILHAVFLGLSAALFEELGRYILMSLLMKKKRSFKNALFFGLGHGGVEAILMVGINTLLILIYYKGISGQPLMMLLAGAERLSAMTFHVLWSIMVMFTIKEKRPIYLLLAILTHFLLDTGVVLTQLVGIDIVIIEIGLLLFAVLAFIYINRFKGKWRNNYEEIS